MSTYRKPLVVMFVAAGIAIAACKKDDPPAKGIDQGLFDMAKQTAGFIWYKNSETLLNKSQGSGHNYSLLRTRYNTTAATMLGTDGKIKAGAVFPEGSLVVKELTNGNTAERYAILLKRAGHEAADERGWVWGYINMDGTVAEPASEKGGECKGCHGQQDNIDYMLMNKFFP